MLAGKRIGFRLDRMWRAWDWISEQWAEKLPRRRRRGELLALGRPLGRRRRAHGAEFKEFLKTIDVAVVGLANCGSCTGWTVRDAITAANAGLPTTAIATAEFRDLRA